MTERSREELERLISDAALLPSGDPLRIKVEAEVAQAGPWAEQAWVDILSSDEHLRIVLRQVPGPPGLAERLGSIPDQEGIRPWSLRETLLPIVMWIGERLSWRSLAVPATALCLGALLWRQVVIGSDEERKLHTVALLAMQDHMNESDMVVRASDPAHVSRELSRIVNFAVRLPDLGRGLKLVGGRACHLGSHRVALTLWTGDRQVQSLYQFTPSELGIERLDRPVVVRPHGPVAGHTPCEVLFWSDAGTGYALVTRPAHGT